MRLVRELLVHLGVECPLGGRVHGLVVSPPLIAVDGHIRSLTPTFSLITRAGLPATVVCARTSFSTTEPMPISAPGPTTTRCMMHAFGPIHASAPTVTEPDTSAPATIMASLHTTTLCAM